MLISPRGPSRYRTMIGPLHLIPCLLAPLSTSALSQWQPLPHVHVERRQVLAVGGAILGAFAAQAQASANSISFSGPRSVISVDSHLAIPVWPSWAGGRVVPVALGGKLQEPLLLLAHHKHWFDPRDPLRGPFKQAGKLLGLPYVDVEGFQMHPHRGFDIVSFIRCCCIFIICCLVL